MDSKESSRRLRIIKNRKPRELKSSLSIFSCLNVPIKASEQKLEIKPVVMSDNIEHSITRPTRMARRLEFLDKAYPKGKVITPKRVRRYVKLLKYFNREIPQNIQEAFSKLKPQKKKYRKIGKKTSKRKRTPSKYSVYIKSKQWQERKNKYFQKFGRFCEKCKSTNKMSLHHLVYNSEMFGREPDEELVALCWKCHTDFHNEYGVTKDCRVEFKEFMLKL